MEQEKSFAKQVVYIMRAQAPPSWWHLFIPFKFLLEYFSFKKNVRVFTEKHLLLKRMALSAAFRAAESGNRDQRREEMQAELRDFCIHHQDPYFQKLYDRLAELADLLLAHYQRLLETDGKDYHAMVRSAYGFRAQYRQFLNLVEAAEAGIDQAVVDALWLESPDPNIRSRQAAMREARHRALDEIFK